MSVKGKKALGTVVECVETSEEASALLTNDLDSVSPPTNPALHVSSLTNEVPANVATKHQRVADDDSGMFRRKRWNGNIVRNGSPLNLISFFTFSSSRRNLKNQRSCSAAGQELLRRTEGVVGTMSRSANDVHSLSGGSLAPSRNGHASCSASLEEETSQNEDDLHQRERDSWERSSRGECGSASEGNEQRALACLRAPSESSITTSQQPAMRRIAQLCSQAGSSAGLKKMRECPLCFIRQPAGNFPKLTCCNHRSCRSCLVQYLQVEIMESRVQVTCPECSELLHPTDVYSLMVHHPALIDKYESFSLRRVLMTDPDTRWCPAPDCTYAVIASNCAACPQLRCERPGCGTLFCYHCKGQWHASQTCDEARKERGGLFRSPLPQIASSSVDNSLKRGDIKACPRCRTYIVKMNDGSCNHMVCAMCSTEFCWLCLKEINDLHYLSPTGCTFWGKKPWTRKKKLLWQIGTLIGAPVAIALIAGLAIPGIVFGVPVFVGRKVNQRFAHHSKARRRLLTTSSVIGSLVVSPVLAVMAVGVGVPIMLAYVYGVVPLSLCRNGGCGVGAGSSRVDLSDIDDEEIWHEVNAGDQEKSRLLNDVERQDGTSVVTGLSINSGLSSVQQPHGRLQVQAELGHRRLSVESGVMSLGEKCNYEEASTKAMAGSQYYDDKSVHTMCSGQEAVSYCDEAASTVALAGSVIDAKSLTDSASGRVVVAQLCCRDRDLSPTSHHTVAVGELARSGEDRPSSSGCHHPHHDAAHTHCREDVASCGSCKRRARATSTASGGSGRAHRVSPHSNPQQFMNLVIATNTEGDSDEMMLMSEDTVLQIASENGKNQSLASGTLRQPHLESGVGPSSQITGSAMWGVHASDGEAPHDRFHIRALFDAMKQIVSDDVAVEVGNEAVAAHIRPSTNGIRSATRYSGSVRSVAQFTVDSGSGTDLCRISRNRTPSSIGSDQHRVAHTTEIHSSSSSNNLGSAGDNKPHRKQGFFSSLLRRSRRH
uniref:RBR-type E3 ubiquitin transferase n=1 Tax=Parascaris univalens TaxID=6257 RepID=A0A915AWJ9_PARUN